MQQQGKANIIGLIGPWHSNLGDAAIQEAMMQHIKEYRPNATIIGYSLSPEHTEARHGIKSYPLGWHGEYSGKLQSLWNLRNHPNPRVQKLGKWLTRAPLEIGLWVQAFKNLRGVQMFFISGGGQLDDYWGGAWSHPYTLFKYTLLAKLRGAKVCFVSVGAGPLDSPLSRFFDRTALTAANYRSYRDADSRKFITEVVGFKRDDPVYPDLAFSWQVKDHHYNQVSSEDRPIVAIGPMSYFDPRIWPEKDEAVYRDYLSKLATFSEWLLAKNYRILFITGEAVHDRWAIDDLRQILAERGVSAQDDRIIDEHIESVDDLMGKLATVSWVVASRFHGVLLSLLLHKPVLALSYHRKINELMADTGQSQYCLSIADFQVDTLQERFESLEANSEKASAQISERVGTYQAALAEQYKVIFSER
ncbi:MAG: polysaccharide pyruvyl transferase family protein [Candidatus Promineifilaceae bacterium]|nr:polysaccharide pyruvyl transferase family protein [Anaerolineaceae bacterium]